jgi:hypothetical protein
VAAAKTPEPERACPAAGLNVGRFGADAERDGDLADRNPLVFTFQQRAGLAPHVFAAVVELHDKGIHGLAHPRWRSPSSSPEWWRSSDAGR